jgi:hypothetical protein
MVLFSLPKARLFYLDFPSSSSSSSVFIKFKTTSGGKMDRNRSNSLKIEQNGSKWIKMGHLGSKWAIWDQNGPFGIKMGHLGSK